jgi:hypothetical protein
LATFDENKIKKIIRQLDSDIPKENASVKMIQYGGGPDESQLTANRNGYLRFGIELLKSAYAKRSEGKKDKNYIEVDLDYLITDDSSISFDWFERTENIKAEFHEQSFIDRCIPYVLFGTFIGVGILTLVGFVTVVNWFF